MLNHGLLRYVLSTEVNVNYKKIISCQFVSIHQSLPNFCHIRFHWALPHGIEEKCTNLKFLIWLSHHITYFWIVLAQHHTVSICNFRYGWDTSDQFAGKIQLPVQLDWVMKRCSGASTVYGAGGANTSWDLSEKQEFPRSDIS